MDCSPPGSSVHGILQARILKWVAMPSSRGFSWLRDQTHISCGFCIAGRFFARSAIREVPGILANETLFCSRTVRYEGFGVMSKYTYSQGFWIPLNYLLRETTEWIFSYLFFACSEFALLNLRLPLVWAAPARTHVAESDSKAQGIGLSCHLIVFP